MKPISKEILSEVRARFPGKSEFSRKDIHFTALDMGYSVSKYLELVSDKFKVSRGVYSFELVEDETTDVKQVSKPRSKKADVVTAPSPVISNRVSPTSLDEGEVFVPQKDSCYVPWGNFSDVVEIIKSQQFYPTFITGMSGNGKTMMVEQACAKLKREYVRVQITPETDEDDLLGGFRLINGETIFAYGPVIKAMRRGAILLIDEIDRGSNKLMCLQSVLEGKPVLLKKTGEVIKPEPGFNIIATANTKGKGSEDGRYTAAMILDDAFLERFIDTMDQDYPKATVEKKILINHMEKYNKVDEEFASNLITWAEIIRKTFADGGVDEVITTRRLCHIAQIYSIFGDRMKAVSRGIARFDVDTNAAFADLYTKVDNKVLVSPSEEPEVAVPAPTAIYSPF